MGRFYDAIKPELDAAEAGGTASSAPAGEATFGADYSSNPTVVREVQEGINAAGYQPPLSVDGSAGPATKAGVVWLQGQRGLTQDGIIGDQTLGALGITPPSGVSTEFAKGVLKGAAAQAVAAIQAEFAPLFSWAQHNPQPVSQGKGIAPGFAATKASVVKSYVDWTTPFEGFLPWMYIDRLGWVTTGMGNLIDPVSMALPLPWKNSDGSRATPDQIAAAWNTIDGLRSDPKGQVQTSGPGSQGGGTQGGYTSIRITKQDVQTLVASKMRENEQHLLAGLPNFAHAPADAQLAAHSMAWAMGPGFATTWANFRSLFNAGSLSPSRSSSRRRAVRRRQLAWCRAAGGWISVRVRGRCSGFARRSDERCKYAAR